MARKIEVQITGDASSFQRALGQASGATTGLGKTFAKVGKTAALVAGAAGIGALIGTLKVGVDEFMEAQKVGAQTNAVLKSTGRAAKVTAKDVEGLAESIMNKSGMDDEAVQSGENLLLTFTNIRNEAGKGNDIFTQTTRIMADMSVALGQDTKSSAIQLGKALNDPIKGVTALRRVGVSFSESQLTMIKRLVESGDVLGAQKLILRELNKEFGGSAEAMGKTLPGKINILKQRFSNFAGDLVARMVPAIEAVADAFNDTLDFVQKLARAPSIDVALTIAGEKLSDAKDFGLKFFEGFKAQVDRVNWQEVGTRISAGLSASLTVTEEGILNMVEAIRSHAQLFADVGAEIAVRIVTTLTDPAFWAKHIDLLAILVAARFGGTILRGVAGLGVRVAGRFLGELGAAIGARLGPLLTSLFSRVPTWIAVPFQLAARAAVVAITTIVTTLRNDLQNILKKVPGWLSAAFKISAVVALVGWVQKLWDWLKKITEKAWNIVVKVSIPGKGILGKAKGLVEDIPGLAAGGPVSAGRAYMVGERGRELFVPNQSGRIIPNNRLAGAGGQTLVFNFPNYVGNERDLMQTVRSEVTKLRRRGGSF